MTLFLPLEASAPVPSHPSFVNKPSDVQIQLEKVMKTILKAKRIVVICGAGISVHAGIPDFRSSEGLFQSLKRDNPKEALASGKDLFDASVFKSENMTSLFCQMISRLSHLSEAADPTPFHKILHTLDTKGKLLRVYTQNIDAIEEKSGLSFGVPDYEAKRAKARTKGKDSTKDSSTLAPPTPTPPSETPSLNANEDPGPSTSRVSTPPITSTTPPRCIPLHGTLQSLHCEVCKHSCSLSSHISSLSSGVPPDCPECISMEKTRQLIGKRARGIGKLRPSVVLYNEEHKDGEGVGEVVSRDLMGTKGKSGADLLLVVGTSLKIPGTKRMVREFAKAVHPRGSGAGKETEKDKEKKEKEKDQDGQNQSSSNSEPVKEEDVQSQPSQQPLKALYLNLDFPVPTREWEGVFDAWVQGDAQTFAEMLREEIERDTRAKEVAKENADERKRKRELKEKEKEREREQEIATALRTEGKMGLGQTPKEFKPKSKKKMHNDECSPKKRKTGKDMAHSSHTAPVKRKQVMVVLPAPKNLLRPKSETYSQFEPDVSTSSTTSRQQRSSHPFTAPLHLPVVSTSLPTPPSPSSPIPSPASEYRDSLHRIQLTDYIKSYPSTADREDYHLPHLTPTAKRHHSYPSYTQPDSAHIPRTPINKQHPSSLNWTLPTPEQSPALHNSIPYQHTTSHQQPYHEFSFSRTSQAGEDSHCSSHSQSSSSRSRPRSPARSYSHPYHSLVYFGARPSSISPPPSPLTPRMSRSQSQTRSQGPSEQTSTSSSSISSPAESESSETEADEDSEMTTEDDRVGTTKIYSFNNPPFLSQLSERRTSSTSSHPYRCRNTDTDMDVDIEGISDSDPCSPADDFRNRLGMSYMRTTQVADGG
ncbi:DHS-like NAD/FAD-binding domain-containing protein [Dendrothele bispora CBS 962.96]|uniref:DHS-like NAD/FAD-binding domain-containing protein n=1 Tax=Dendrothele bispora (strain CBS 962.96) TaxID=1314807 RepID=A0A4S8MCB2_DENBC|nr:DHS-like NAD/FAD-binding domain-containing protein [Dendrothele bispora CBS 962.96]